MAFDWDPNNQAMLDEWGEPVTMWPNTSFEQEFIALKFTSAVIESRVPGSVERLFFKASDLPSIPADSDEVDIDGVIYVVTKPELDEGGGLILVVRKKRI